MPPYRLLQWKISSSYRNLYLERMALAKKKWRETGLQSCGWCLWLQLHTFERSTALWLMIIIAWMLLRETLVHNCIYALPGGGCSLRVSPCLGEQPASCGENRQTQANMTLPWHKLLGMISTQEFHKYICPRLDFRGTQSVLLIQTWIYLLHTKVQAKGYAVLVSVHMHIVQCACKFKTMRNWRAKNESPHLARHLVCSTFCVQHMQ